jgi:2-keto-4-pentenoate hydratase/2-oxohepta-3-ene-1,7-dioic acid hydratase in catechol pathway
MKLATFTARGGAPVIGVVDVDRKAVLDLQAAARMSGGDDPAFTDMLALIDAGSEGLARTTKFAAAWPDQAAYTFNDIKLLAPLPEPRQIRDCLVFEEHFANSLKRSGERNNKPPQPIPDVWYRQPIYYKANRFSVVGHETDVIWPSYSNWMDFELELGCVIGKTGKDIAPERAFDHIFGFTIFNDFSARDAQYAEMEGRLGPAKGKDFDTGNVVGPWIVTIDEIGNPHDLKMDARVNGERWGGGSSRAMHHTFNAMLAHISMSETIRAGELICSGTVGTGCGNEVGRKIQPDDVIELEIQKIGILRNRLVRP